MLKIEKYIVGPLKTNCYLIEDSISNESAIVDPGGISYEINKKIKDNQLNVKYILLTHGHFDHIRKADHYRTLTDSKIVIPYTEKNFLNDPSLNPSPKTSKCFLQPFQADILTNNGDILYLGTTPLEVKLTPGHTIGSCCYISKNFIFTGDTLMHNCFGRTDFPTGNPDNLKKSIEDLYKIITDQEILPGHGETFKINNTLEN